MRGPGAVRCAKLALCAALLAAACAGLGGGAASASSAGNHTIYQDPVGDNGRTSTTNYASDIQTVDVTSTDLGVVHISTTLADADARLVQGDELDVLIDYDRNRNTGQSGFDLELVATGHASGTPTSFVLCRLGQQSSCETGPDGWAHDQPSGPGKHIVDFLLTMGIPAFDFGVVETYTSSAGPLTDIAPNSGLWTFETKADPDNDGLYGSSDRCPTVAARGKFDRNNNGCLGPFASISAKEVHFSGVAYPGYLRLRDVRVTGLPPGSDVVFSSSHGGDRAKANSSGTARSRRVSGNFSYGSLITIRITKEAFVGIYLKEVVTKSGLKVKRRACIPATGGPPVKCSSALSGK